jgi:hypothetical protein
VKSYTNWYLPENEARIRQAVAESTTMSEVVRKLGLKVAGGNFEHIRYHIVRLNLPTDHHVGQRWNRENYKEYTPKRARDTLRAFLIRTHGHRCWQCNLTDWQGQPVPLEMDHIDGDNQNNSLDNLRILCCNCHALTPTYKGRSRKNLPA